MKRCSACKKYKSLTEFGIRINVKAGLYFQCKECKANFSEEQFLTKIKKIVERLGL